MIAFVLMTNFQKNVLEYFKKVTQAMSVLIFNGLQKELLALPLVSMNQDDGDPVGAGLIKLKSSGELNVSSVSHNRSRVRNSCLKNYGNSIMVDSPNYLLIIFSLFSCTSFFYC